MPKYPVALLSWALWAGVGLSKQLDRVPRLFSARGGEVWRGTRRRPVSRIRPLFYLASLSWFIERCVALFCCGVLSFLWWQLTPMEMMKLRMRKALDSQLQKDKTAIAKKSTKESKMAELDRKLVTKKPHFISTLARRSLCVVAVLLRKACWRRRPGIG